jgi:hypothetical protein
VLDVSYLYALGDAALPAVVEALPSLPDRDRTCLDALLRWQLSLRRDEDPRHDWRSWNDDRARAAEARRSFAAVIPASIRDPDLPNVPAPRRLQNAFRLCAA